MTRIVADALRERGYLASAITPRAELEHAPERATLMFTIEPGPQTTIGKIEIINIPSASRTMLLDRLGITHDLPYEHDTLNTHIKQYIKEQRNHDYYKAHIPTTMHTSDDSQVADLTLTITPNPHIHIIFANDPLPTNRHTNLIPTKHKK